MTDEQNEGIYIDTDWKEEAAREKEQLAAQDENARQQEDTPAGFLELVNLLMMQAIIGLGGFQGPGGETIPPNPAAAKHHISLLEVLKSKTEGNLSTEEAKAIDDVLHELRMQFIKTMSDPPPKTDAK